MTSTRFAVALHMIGLMAFHEERGRGTLTSEEMAASVGTNPVVIKRLLGVLSRAGIITTKRGAGGGSWLARPAAQITLLEVMDAVNGDEPTLTLRPGDPGMGCVVAPYINSYLHDLYADVEKAMRDRLEAVTVTEMNHSIGLRKAGADCA